MHSFFISTKNISLPCSRPSYDTSFFHSPVVPLPGHPNSSERAQQRLRSPFGPQARMSANSSAKSVGHDSRRPGLASHLLDPSTAKSGPDDHDVDSAASPNPRIARHYYTSLTEHAEIVQKSSRTGADDPDSSPRAGNRREGFSWDVGIGEELRRPTPSTPRARTPPTLEELFDSASSPSTAKKGPIVSSQTPPLGNTERNRSDGRALGGMRFINARRSRKQSRSDPTSPGLNNSTPELRSPGIPGQQGQTKQELDELGLRSRSRRFRWSGNGTSSNDLNESQRPDRPQSPFAFFRFRASKRGGPQTPAPSLFTKSDKSYWRQKQPITVPSLETIDKMPLPPSFIPPGLNRVPTPPTLNASDEVKDKLADFHFDLQGVRTHKPARSPGAGGIWDSETLLMSQDSNVLPRKSDSESPEDPVPAASPSDAPTHPLLPTTITPTSGAYMATTPPHYSEAADWSHIYADPMDPSELTARAAEERAKLEWLVPEHLPSSPLCPLYEKYTGPSPGLCPYHGRRKSLVEGKVRAGNGQRGKRGGVREDRQEERRKGSAVDGSGEWQEGEVLALMSRSRRGKRRWRFRVSVP